MKLEDLYRVDSYAVPPDVMERLKLLFPKLQQLESAYLNAGGSPFVITRGFSTWDEHKAIYQAINDKRLIVGQQPLPIPIHSAHLSGDAVDLWDQKGDLKNWASTQVPLLETLGFWCEAFYATPDWMHVQQTAPRSGNRFFRP